jgi:hypothetical protein
MQQHLIFHFSKITRVGVSLASRWAKGGLFIVAPFQYGCRDNLSSAILISGFLPLSPVATILSLHQLAP